jgi:hypothetical protein
VRVVPESVIVVGGAVCLAGEDDSSSSDMVREALGLLRVFRVVSVAEMSVVKSQGTEIPTSPP